MIESIVPVLVGGLLALAGAFVGPHFARRHERWRAKREDEQQLRGKAEEFFDALDQLVSDSQDATLAAIRHAKDQDVEVIRVPDLGRVRALSSVYFPTCSGVISKFESNAFESSRKLLEILTKETQSENPNEQRVRLIQSSMVTQRNSEIAQLAKDLRREITSAVPRIE